VKKSDAKTWFGEEKLPAGYVKPVKPITLSDSGTLSNAIGSMSQKIVAASVKTTTAGKNTVEVPESVAEAEKVVDSFA